MPVLDERTFESVVELSPEEQESNDNYLRDKGYQIEVESEPASAGVAEETKPEQQDTVVEATPATEQAEGVDAETHADWQAAKNDGEKLGKYAKQTLRRKAVEADLVKEKAINEELRRQLDSRNVSSSAQPTAVTQTSQLTPPGVVAQPKEETKPEPPKPKEFDKVRPERPKYENFLTADDPIAAHADAVAEWNEKLSDWREDKREFDRNQQAEIEQQTRQQEQVRTQEKERAERYNTRYREVQTAHPDFETVTKGVIYNPVLLYLLGDPEGLKDGMELYYQLAQPEHRELLNDLVKNTQTVQGENPRTIERKLMEATQELAVFRHSLKNKPAPVAEAPPVVTETPKPTPPTAVETRREEAAPTPVRSRGAAATRLEDIPLSDYDARRKWRESNGQL